MKNVGLAHTNLMMDEQTDRTLVDISIINAMLMLFSLKKKLNYNKNPQRS